MANLRGDATDFDKQVSLLCYASAVVIVFCGNFGMKERKLLASWRDNASHLILINCSETMEEDSEENRNEKMKQITMKDLELSEQFVIDAYDADEDTLAKKLRDTLNILLPHLPATNIVATAGIASDLNMNVDEDKICRMAFSEVEEVLNGIENGVKQFFEEQLPLQGPIWKRLCHLEKEEGRLKDNPNERLQLNQEQTGGKERLVEELMSYKLTAEGLNHPQVTQQEESLVHDNELATFVTGLSDVTLVNLPQNGLAGTRQNLQIAVNAFLRTKDSERRPTFQVVSEGPIKDAKIMGCIVEILSQEKCAGKVGIELHHDKVGGIHENLVGPWTNLSLCKESNRIYSDTALELKQRLLAAFHEKAITGQPTCLGAFMEHMCNVWESVKNQNFEVGFGDRHVADALISLCTKLVEDEQELTDLMDHWVQDLDTQITELKESASQNGNYKEDTDDILKILKKEAAMQINSKSEKIKSSLWEYLRQENINLGLMETYKANLLRRVHSTEQQVTLGMNPKIESAIVRHNLSTKMQALLTALEAALEVKLRSLLESCKNSDTIIEDIQLEKEFTTVWNDIPSNLDLPSRDM
ncbi:hypothetical protein P4O66_003139 [Electrophorus voltai]|uniref:Uncharacterized protein n=1 Tax=Electrophorus voltai TaxID=2609070 RepID=A0AAD8YRX6_9TELE|nr:hypothetical protein P4O66_003139 [Electrophorus voltai]